MVEINRIEWNSDGRPSYEGRVLDLEPAMPVRVFSSREATLEKDFKDMVLYGEKFKDETFFYDVAISRTLRGPITDNAVQFYRERKSSEIKKEEVATAAGLDAGEYR